MSLKRRSVLSVMVIVLLIMAGNAFGLTSQQIQALQKLSPSQREMLSKMSPQEIQALAQQLPPEQRQAIQQMSPADIEKLKTGQLPKSSDVIQPGDGAPEAVMPTPTKAEPEPGVPEDSALAGSKGRALEPFGYDLFHGAPSTFAPATDIPIPADYVIGPGDTIQLQLFGKTNAEYTLVVTRDGTVQIPEIGPKTVAGLKFSEMQDRVDSYVRNQMIGVRSSVTMGPLRSIRIFILGDAVRPGSYTVSSLSSMTNALLVSGGIRTIGSLRNIQLKRSGALVGALDLYDLLLKGDNSKDQRLLPGDVIFIPPVGPTVGIGGGVKRPAVYELQYEKSVDELVAMAGGLVPTAFKSEVKLERLADSGDRLIIDVDLNKPADLGLGLTSGDVLWVGSALEVMENFVKLSGHVHRPGSYQWRRGVRVTDVIGSIEDGLLPRPELYYALVKRQLPPDYRVEIHAIHLKDAFEAPASADNMPLQPRDEIIVFSITEDRAKTLAPIIKQLRDQALFGQPEPVASIDGFVAFPGVYPLTFGMRFSDLAQASVLKPHTDLEYALVVRDHGSNKPIEVFSVVPGQAVANPGSEADMHLQPKDRVLVFDKDNDRRELIDPVISALRRQARIDQPEQVVVVAGQVRFPGEYPLSRGMRVSDLVRAGGDLQQKGYKLEAELIRFMVMDEKRRDAIRIPIDLAAVNKGDISKDIPVESFDTLTLKQVVDWRDVISVEVIGEVNYPGAYVAKPGDTLSELIERAGGFGVRAYPGAAVFVREELRVKEQRQLDQMRDRLREDLAAMELKIAQEDPKVQEAYGSAQDVLGQLETTKAVGRLVIDLESIINGVSEDVVLKDGDRLFVPNRPQEVTVIGEVYHPTSHLFTSALSRDEYIKRSGGFTVKADKDRIYVVKANGQVIAPGGGWFGSGQQPIDVGDTIVVPLDVDRVRPLYFWTSIAQIVYQSALAVAAFNSVGVF